MLYYKTYDKKVQNKQDFFSDFMKFFMRIHQMVTFIRFLSRHITYYTLVQSSISLV